MGPLTERLACANMSGRSTDADVADAAGYLDGVAQLLWRDLGAPHVDWLRAFVCGAYGVSLTAAARAFAAAVYFLRRPTAERAVLGRPAGAITSRKQDGLEPSTSCRAWDWCGLERRLRR